MKTSEKNSYAIAQCFYSGIFVQIFLGSPSDLGPIPFNMSTSVKKQQLKLFFRFECPTRNDLKECLMDSIVGVVRLE